MSRQTLHRLGCALGASIAAANLFHPSLLLAQPSPPGLSASRGIALDRARVAQLLPPFIDVPDTASASDALLTIRIVEPIVNVIWNSQLPSDGAAGQLWAGRGANTSVIGGLDVRWRWGKVTLLATMSPALSYSQNTPFQFLVGREPGRSAFSSPWHLGIASADLPSRFGDQSIRTVGLGESAVSITGHGVSIGASSSNEWWGPALRNTLVLSDNAPGIPRLFVRTARPIRTRVGVFDGRLIIGTLTESAYFDTDASNDYRSASGALFTYSPLMDTLLTIGISRLVIAPSQTRFAFDHAIDALTRWEPIASPASIAGGRRQSSDQISSLFARWRFPASGLETYGEWARMELPRSLREMLTAPQSTSAYTIGAQVARGDMRRSAMRVQVEISYLEQTPTLPDRPPPDYYTGRATSQGFTQRGQVLGAGIGPGSSSQFIAMDRLAPRWQVGLFGGRVRRENDALYRQVLPRFIDHDVEVYAGIRGGLLLARGDVSAELAVGKRQNYLFENAFHLGEPVVANDVQNVTISLMMTPHLRKAGR